MQPGLCQPPSVRPGRKPENRFPRDEVNLYFNTCNKNERTFGEVSYIYSTLRALLEINNSHIFILKIKVAKQRRRSAAKLLVKDCEFGVSPVN